MPTLKQLLKQAGISYRQCGDGVQLSAASINNIVNHNKWPTHPSKAQVINSLTQFLTQKGLNPTQIQQALAQPAANDPILNLAQNKEYDMLLRKQTLTTEAKKHFKLFSNPFTHEVQNTAELFLSPDIRYVRESMYHAAKNGGFIAVCGESGAGKSTLRRDLLDRIQREKLSIITIEPYVLAAEDNDIKGKTLKSAHIAEAILASLAPLTNPKRSPEARFRQIHNLLKQSSRAGNSHVLIIEEAHSLPIPTLKHLKRFYELEDGFKKLLSIVLIGQNELALKLSEQDQEVREVVQRCEIVTLEPLTQTSLQDYLNHRVKQHDRKLSDFIDASGIDGIAARLSQHAQGKKTHSLLYPLAVGNLITAALNSAADIGVPYITYDVIKGV